MPSVAGWVWAASHAERLATTARVGRIGVMELEAAAYERTAVVEAHAEQVQQRLGVAHDPQCAAIVVHLVVIRCSHLVLALEVHLVTEPRAAALTHAHAQQKARAAALGAQLLEVAQRLIGQGDGRLLRRHGAGYACGVKMKGWVMSSEQDAAQLPAATAQPARMLAGVTASKVKRYFNCAWPASEDA